MQTAVAAVRKPSAGASREAKEAYIQAKVSSYGRTAREHEPRVSMKCEYGTPPRHSVGRLCLVGTIAGPADVALPCARCDDQQTSIR